jgi:hypothetical protein
MAANKICNNDKEAALSEGVADVFVLILFKFIFVHHILKYH